MSVNELERKIAKMQEWEALIQRFFFAEFNRMNFSQCVTELYELK